MILGIDPGPFQSAYVFWDGSQVAFRHIVPSADISNVIDNSPGIVVAVEHLQCFGMSVGASVFETAYWIGEFRRCARQSGCDFRKVFRSEVKMHFCNSMRAKDSNIRQALIDRFGAPGTKKNRGVTYGVHGDMWSALAIAVMVHDTQ